MNTLYNVKQSVTAGLRRILVPLVKLLIRSGITYPEFAEVAKEAYVSVCAAQSASEETSIARLSILSGLPRREVSRLVDSGKRFRATDEGANQVVRLLVGWHEDKDFLGPYGVPRNLYFNFDPSGAATFEVLVTRYANQLSASQAFKTLEKSGAVIRTGVDAPIQVTRRDLVIDSEAAGTVDFYARAMSGFLETSVQNLCAGAGDKVFQRWVVPDHGIRKEDWPVFSEIVKERLEPVLRELDTKFAALEAPNASDATGCFVGVGFYIYGNDLDS